MDFLGPVSGGLLAVLLFGCFVQVITILSLVRYGLGLSGFEMGLVSFLLALVLSLYMVEAKFGIKDALEKTVRADPIVFNESLEAKVKPYLLSATDPDIARRMRSLSSSSTALAGTEMDQTLEPTLAEVEGGYLLTQLKRSLSVGLILLIPLILIDVLVAVTLTVVGVQGLSVAVVAIPLKLLLFVAIDGWGLIVNKLLLGFI